MAWADGFLKLVPASSKSLTDDDQSHVVLGSVHSREGQKDIKASAKRGREREKKVFRKNKRKQGKQT